MSHIIFSFNYYVNMNNHNNHKIINEEITNKGGNSGVNGSSEQGKDDEIEAIISFCV